MTDAFCFIALQQNRSNWRGKSDCQVGSVQYPPPSRDAPHNRKSVLLTEFDVDGALDILETPDGHGRLFPLIET